MRFCTSHWEALRLAIEDRGLSALVPENGEKAASNLTSELTDGRSIDNYDPLMAAHFAIISNAMSVAGGAYIEMLAGGTDAAEWCPLCFVNEKNPYGYNYDVWINMAADEQVEEWKRLAS